LAESRAPKHQTREEARFANASNGHAVNPQKGAPYEVADVPDGAYPDGQLASAAVRHLEAAAEYSETPFFIAVGFVKPHLPFCAPKKYWDMHDPAAFEPARRQSPPDGAPPYAPTTWGELRQYRGMPDEGPVNPQTQRTLIHGYYAATSYMDAQVGKVLNALDELDLAKNTIVVLWGDHGWHLGDHGMWCKHTNYEQAARIPLVVVAPGVTEPGVASAALIESVDVYPTLCALAGIDAPAQLDGASAVATLRDPAAATKSHVTHVYPRGERLGRAVRTARHRLVEWKKPGAPADMAEIELYDYHTDPAETKNLATDQPHVVAELRELLAAQGEAKPQIKPAGQDRDRRPRQRRRASRQAS
jgi:iduronate 2-sulfatase